jgi:hypothetical protein
VLHAHACVEVFVLANSIWFIKKSFRPEVEKSWRVTERMPKIKIKISNEQF